MATLALAPHRHLRPRYRYWLVIVLLTMTVAPAFAQAFRWVGQDGSLHLSDRPPPTKAQPWYPVEIPRYNQPSLPPKQNPYSVINQLKRMEERRVAVREKRWQERLEDLEQQRQRRELANDEVELPRTTPRYIYRPPIAYQKPRRRARRRYDEPPFTGTDHPIYRAPRQRRAAPKSYATDRATR